MNEADEALVVGEALVDVIRDGRGAVSEHAGGSPANVAVGLARLGRPTTLLTRLGEDRHGRLVAEHLHREGVALPLGRQAAATSYAEALIGPDGSADYRFSLEWTLPELPDLAEVAELPRPIVVHTGSLGAVVPPGADTVIDLLSARRGEATVTYDLNIRPAVMGEGADLWARVARVVALADVVKASDEDLAHLVPGATASDAARRLLDLGPVAVVVTGGGEGAVCLTRHGSTSTPAPEVVVADTVGAGDSFCSAMIDRLWEWGALGGSARPTLRSLDLAAWSDVLDHAAAAAAITVSRPGANPPTRADLESAPGRRPGALGSDRVTASTRG
ncbi:carbohydrate kinase [Nocardioides panacihumi]|uniref:Carbohydrate kinase n=1 Tax=Nocardioides panacihumi TaxID=400774 RepID=A0ABP5C0J6_9ACTN